MLALAPGSVLAANVCCSCKGPPDPASVTCLTIDSEKLAGINDCTSLPASVKLPAGWSCDKVPLDPQSKCRTTTDGGACPKPPTSAYSYAAPEGAGAAAAGSGSVPAASPPVVPDLNVQIPGLTFTGGEASQASSSLIAQYVAAAFRYVISIAAVAATIMFVYGAFLYLLGSAIPSIARGKDIMKDAVVGMLLVLGAHLILRTINPALINLNSIALTPIIPQDLNTVLFNQFGTTDINTLPEGTSPGGRPSDPNVPCPTPQPPSGKGAWERMQAACAGKSGSKEGIVEVLKVWKQIGVDQSGSAYIRGGSNGGKNMTFFPPQPGFMFAALYKTSAGSGGKAPHDWLSDQTKAACGVPAGIEFNGGEMDVLAFAQKHNMTGFIQTYKLYTSNSIKKLKDDPCFNWLQTDYYQKITYPVACNDLVTVDCGTHVNQTLKCAGLRPMDNQRVEKQHSLEKAAQGNKPNMGYGGIINIYKANEAFDVDVDGKKVSVKKGSQVAKKHCDLAGSGKCKNETIKGYVAHGTNEMISLIPKFPVGTAIGIFCGSGVSHYIMYTGGAGLNFETFESGSALGSRKAPTGFRASRVSFPNWNGDPNFGFGLGMASSGSLQQYIQSTGCNADGSDGKWYFALTYF